jgi:hypothetical protein
MNCIIPDAFRLSLPRYLSGKSDKKFVLLIEANASKIQVVKTSQRNKIQA